MSRTKSAQPKRGLIGNACFAVASTFVGLLAILVGLIVVFDTPPIDYSVVSSTRTFSNYGGNLNFAVEEFHQPSSEAEIVALVNRARQTNKTIRVVGAGHSWSPLVKTPHILINLDKMNRILSVDKETHLVRVQAGIRLKDLGPQLWDYGLAMPILGTIDQQSIAGAISTGTHGSGQNFHSFPSIVKSLRIVVGDGRIIDASPESNQDVFNASRVSFGSMGVITELTLQCVPRFNLKRVYRPMPLNEALEITPKLVRENTYYKLWWLTHSENTRLWIWNPTEEPVSPHLSRDIFVDSLTNRLANGLFWLSAGSPAATRIVSNILSIFANTNAEAVGRSYEMFTWPVPYSYMESEWFIPVEKIVQVFTEYKKLVEKHQCSVNYVSEIRFIKADDVWLSPAYNRESATLNLLLTGNEKEFYRCATLMQELMTRKEIGGRPHWGKYHTLNGTQLRAIYSDHWDQFVSIRNKYDPDGVFLNDIFEWTFPSIERTIANHSFVFRSLS